ncbi:MAG TPA: ABC transporter permease, partial [Gemmatimonadaceae bacterium]|nr:ABC transporter permease [Gemmatimonadaceae bacterium]
LALVALAAVLAPALSPYPPDRILDAVALQRIPPSLAHPLGTDDVGRDLLSRVLHGGRASLGVALLSTLIATTLGTLVGTVAGYVGGATDAVLMRAIDVLLSIPRLLVLVAVLALWPGSSTLTLIVLVGVTSWFPLTRLVRARVRSVSASDHVAAARALGAGHLRLVLRHVLPNAAGTVLVAGTLVAGDVILLEAALSFLGVGLQPPDASWGNLVRDGMGSIATAWWLTLFPGLAIAVTVTAINMLGDALRDTLDPRQLPQP